MTLSPDKREGYVPLTSDEIEDMRPGAAWKDGEFTHGYASVTKMHKLCDMALASLSLPAPCGHPSQYVYTEDGGAHMVCLLCEHALRSHERTRGAWDCPHSTCEYPNTCRDAGKCVAGDFNAAPAPAVTGNAPSAVSNHGTEQRVAAPYRMTAKFDDETRVITGTLPSSTGTTAEKLPPVMESCGGAGRNDKLGFGHQFPVVAPPSEQQRSDWAQIEAWKERALKAEAAMSSGTPIGWRHRSKVMNNEWSDWRYQESKPRGPADSKFQFEPLFLSATLEPTRDDVLHEVEGEIRKFRSELEIAGHPIKAETAWAIEQFVRDMRGSSRADGTAST